MATFPSPHPVGTAAPVAGASTILFIVWPEPGHSVGPLALASRLRARGHRVVFAGLPQHRPFIERHGLLFCGLAAPPGASVGPSVFACPRGAPALAEAAARLIAAFDDVCVRYQPAAVLIDSLFSAFSLLPASRGLPWATYETDLPRELDVGSPPLPGTTRRHAEATDKRARRRAWAELLWATYRVRRDGRASSLAGQFSMESDFPDRLCAALRARVGDSVAFDRRSVFPPVAVGPRLVFAGESMDFPRAARHVLTYGGPCIDAERPEPDFDGSRLPMDKGLVYCSLGTQSFRAPQTPEVLRNIVAAVTACPDLFLVVACPAKYAKLEAVNPERVLLVDNAPQLALLRRASLAITHGGFNGVKECALFGVPQVVLPLSHDQPRNAALVERLGVGVWLDGAELTQERLLWAISRVRHDPRITQRCRVLRQLLEAENASPKAVEFVEQLMLGRRHPHAPANPHHIHQTGESLMNAPCQETQVTEETQEARTARLSSATPQFQRMADELVLRVRRAMGVPDRAEPEVEQEFSALRATLDSFYPEFTQLFSRHLFGYLGRAAPVVISSLESEPVQAYLRVAEGIDAEVNTTLRSFAVRIGAALSPTPVE